MSMGNPVVSTSVGADGIECEDGKHLLTADKAEDFADKVIELMNDRPLFESLRSEAMALVSEKYDWNKIGLMINRSLLLPGSN